MASGRALGAGSTKKWEKIMTDINRFERNGKWYIAQPTEPGRCTMCAFDAGEDTGD